MTGFRVDRFTGLRPIDQARKLPKGAAQIAFDCDLQANDLRVFADAAHVANVTGGFTPKSGFVFSETQMFVFDADVAATYGPIQADVEIDQKVYIGSGFFDYPTYSTARLGLGGQDPYHGEPVASRKLGVPVPDAAPLISSVTANAGGNILNSGTSILTLNGTLSLLLVCDAAHGMDSGARVRLDGFNEDWADISGKVFTVTVITTTSFTLDNYDPDAAGHYTELNTRGLTTESGGGTWVQEWNAEDIEDRLYVYTLVTDQGEEGPPSESTPLVTINPGQLVTITTSTASTVEGATIAFKRIYRTVPATNGTADYYFVAEIDHSLADYQDTVAFIELGEAMQSIDWTPPPEGMVGLTVLPNGIMAGYLGRTLYLSEPYQPHAWPSRYTKKMDNPIVGLAAFAQSLVVATEENPYVGTATDPLSMTLSKLDTIEPCIAGRACKTLGYGACYPSPNGLVLVTPEGSRNVLQNIWGEKEWRALFEGGEAFAAVHDGKYYLMFAGGNGIIFDPTSDSLEISEITLSSVYGAAVDRDEDRLYLLRYSAGPKVSEWNPDDGTTYMETQWKSKDFVMPYPVNMGAYQCFYEGTGDIEIDFYADGVLKYTATVLNQEPARLPSGFLAREWTIEIRTNIDVQGVYVAETIEELRGALS